MVLSTACISAAVLYRIHDVFNDTVYLYPVVAKLFAVFATYPDNVGIIRVTFGVIRVSFGAILTVAGLLWWHFSSHLVAPWVA